MSSNKRSWSRAFFGQGNWTKVNLNELARCIEAHGAIPPEQCALLLKVIRLGKLQVKNIKKTPKQRIEQMEIIGNNYDEALARFQAQGVGGQGNISAADRAIDHCIELVWIATGERLGRSSARKLLEHFRDQSSNDR